MRLGLGGMNSIQGVVLSLGLMGVELGLTQQVHIQGVSYRDEYNRHREKCGDIAQQQLAHKSSEDEYQKVRNARIAIDEELTEINSELDQRRERNFNLKEMEAAAVAAVLEGYTAGITQNRALLGR